MEGDTPRWLSEKAEKYQRLERESSALHQSQLNAGTCQLVVALGALMFVGVVFFKAEHPFYGGVGATLVLIFGARWWWLSGELNRIYSEKVKIQAAFVGSGYKLQYDGTVSPDIT